MGIIAIDDEGIEYLKKGRKSTVYTCVVGQSRKNAKTLSPSGRGGQIFLPDRNPYKPINIKLFGCTKSV